MTQIEKEKINTIVFTLSEKVTITNPVYLFEFVNEYLGTSSTCIMSDISTNKTRYNQFLFTEGTQSVPLEGQLCLLNGSYTYNVYQQTSTQSLVATASQGLLETGKVYVSGTPSNIDEIYL